MTKKRRPPRKDRPPRTPDDTLKLTLKAMANGGYALGTHQRQTYLVPYTIPGETITARPTEQRGKVTFAQGISLLDASADRVMPQCPHFGPGRCWGCQWQHISYEAQLLLKQDVLADQLSRLGKFDDPTLTKAMQPVIPAPEQWGYNHHIIFERDRSGALGLRRMDGRTIEPVQVCLVLHPDLQALYTIIDVDYEQMERLALWLGSDGETMLILTMREEEAPELMTDLPTSVNVLLPDNEPVNLLGETVVKYDIGGRTFRMTAGGSFRANVPQIEPLVQTILEMLSLGGDENVLDLYAGVGVFSAFLAPRAETVTMVESYPPMATDAEENLADLENVDIVEGSVEEVLESVKEGEQTYHAAVIDPPNRGMSKEAMAALGALNLPRLVYIGSDPASFSRDLREFAKQGYKLRRVQPIDFAPQTYYVDAVALLEK